VPSTELVRFDATDRRRLSGLWFEPRRAKSVVIWMHGLGGSIFESDRTNKLAGVFLDRRIAFFPFNNRGAGRYGASVEIIRDCVKDIDGAIREVRRRGYRDITLAGHSTGANKIAVYDHYKKRNPVTRYVLLAGGDDTGGLYRQLGKRRFNALLAKKPGSAMEKAARDMARPNGDYNVFPFDRAIRGRRPFRFIRDIRKPSLYVYGENDEFGFDAELLAHYVGPKAEIVVMRDADHGFHGKEVELATLIADWTLVCR
jgi:pimeloyl-ACP methyl ester carboxylesterase